MNTIKLMVFALLCASVLSACSAKENHENTAETDHTPAVTSSATDAPSEHNNMGDDVKDGAEDIVDGAGNVIDDAGNIVEDAGNAVGGAANEVGDAVKGE